MDSRTLMALLLVQAAWDATASLEGSEKVWARADVCAQACDEELDCRLVAAAVGSTAQRVRELVETARVYPPGARSPKLSFEAHRVLMRTLDPVALVRRADRESWTSRDVYRAAREYRKTAPEPSEEDVGSADPYFLQMEVERLQSQMRVLRKLNLSLLERLAAANCRLMLRRTVC